MWWTNAKGALATAALAALLVGLVVTPAGAAEANPQVDLSVTKTDTMDPVQPGDTFEYPVTVTNNGPSGAMQVFADDTLPAEVEFVSAAGQSCSFGGGVVSCDLGSMLPGESKSFSITVTVRAGTPEGTFLNVVVVGTNEPDVEETNPDNNRAEEPTTVVLGSIGDTVWFDTNSNGVQDSGEPGLAGVTVDLAGPSGPSSATTDADGKYLFDGLLRGDYTVTVTGPDDHDPTTPTQVSHTLGMGEDFLDADFGFVQVETVVLGSIGDTVWFDTNSNGVQDSGEPGLAGVTVDLAGPSGPSSATTDADGKYLFDGLLRGDYTVTVTGPDRHDATTPTQVSHTLGMGEDFLDADFGFVQIDLELTKSVDPASINPGGTATFTIDVVNQGPGDATGVVVGDVLPAGLDYVSHTGTGFDPTTFEWAIGSLPVGASASLSFVVGESGGLAEYVNVAEVIAADQVDKDSDPADGEGDDFDTALIIVVGAQNLGDTVWYDANENRRQDSGEPGIGGVRITVTGPEGTVTATTDSNGKYLLSVAPGTYTVTVDASTVVITDNGVTYSGINVTNTTPRSITADVALNVDNLAFDFGFDIILPPTGLTSGGFAVAGMVILLLGAGLLVVSRRSRQLVDDD